MPEEITEKDQRLADAIVLDKLKPIVQEIAEKGFKEMIQYQRDNNPSVDGKFLDHLEKSEFFRDVYKEGVIKGIESYQNIWKDISFLKA